MKLESSSNLRPGGLLISLAEISRVFRASSKFLLQHQEELPRFLNWDRFDTGVVPLEHIRHVTIEVSLKGFNTVDGYKRPWATAHYQAPLKKHYKRAVDHLDILRTVPHRKDSTLTLIVPHLSSIQPAKLLAFGWLD